MQCADNRTEGTCPRVGFLKGQISVPDNFDRMGEEEILSMFEGEEEPTP